MHSETWLEKAERLQSSLASSGEAPATAADETAARDRIKIALWLRREFSTDDSDEFPPLSLDVL